jgi:ribosomal protein L29
MKNKVNYQELTPTDLANRLTEISEELNGARMKLRAGQFKKFSEFSRLRREIARVKTYMTMKELKK